jgi:hypothetical protein
MGILFTHAFFMKKADLPILKNKAETVKELELTDLCFFTEARYTRHLSQADSNTPFQDYPLSFEHFPSGSLVMPPVHLTTESNGENKSGLD